MRGYLGDKQFTYYGIYEKVVAAFATTWMDCHIEVNKKLIKIPVVFAPREKFLSYITRTGRDGKLNIASTLPMIGFESANMYPDESRAKNQFSPLQLRKDNVTETALTNRIPYNTDFNVMLACKNIKEAAMVFEQVIPTFRPSLTLKVKDFEEYGIESDIEILLTGASPSYEYDGGFDDVRAIIFEFSFTVRHYYYAPIERSNKIKHAVLKMGVTEVAQIMSELTADVNPETANVNDEYEIEYGVKEE